MKDAPTIVHFSTVHHQEDVRVFQKECRTLADEGYSVHLIARGEHDGSLCGVNMHRFVRAKAGPRLARLLVNSYRMFKLVRKIPASIYHFHDLELFFVGAVLRVYGKTVVYDAHEDVAGQIREQKVLPKPVRSLGALIARALETLAGRCFSFVVVANPQQNKPYPKHKVVEVQNFPLRREFEGTVDEANYNARPNRVLYIGGLTVDRGIHEMIAAIDIVNRHRSAELRLAGNFSSAVTKNGASSASGWAHVTYLGVLDRPAVVKELSQSKIGLAIMRPVPNYLTNQPVKVFEYMAAGIPVVASDFENYRPFVEDVGAGKLVDPLRPESIAEAIIELLDNPSAAQEMGRCGREAVLSRWTWDSQAENLLSLYRRLLPDSLEK